MDPFGPKTEIREYSFFNNTRMSAAVRDDKVVVEMCEPGAAGCSDGTSPAPIQVRPVGGHEVAAISAGRPGHVTYELWVMTYEL